MNYCLEKGHMSLTHAPVKKKILRRLSFAIVCFLSTELLLAAPLRRGEYATVYNCDDAGQQSTHCAAKCSPSAWGWKKRVVVGAITVGTAALTAVCALFGPPLIGGLQSKSSMGGALQFSNHTIRCQDIAKGNVDFSFLPYGNTCALDQYHETLEQACLKFEPGDRGEICGLTFVKKGEQEAVKSDSEALLAAMNKQIAEGSLSGYQDYGLAISLDDLMKQESSFESLNFMAALIDIALKGSDSRMLFFQYKGRVFGVSDGEEFKHLLSDLGNGSIKNPNEPLSPSTVRPDIDPVAPSPSGHFSFDMTIHPNTPANQVNAYKQATEVWGKIITGHEKINRPFTLAFTLAPARLNSPEKYGPGRGGLMANALVHGCHHQTSAARDGSIKTDEEKFQDLSFDQTGRVWVAAHEIGHKMIHQAVSHDAWELDEWRNPVQRDNSHQEGRCVTDHYFVKGADGSGYDYFIGPKTIQYFDNLAEQKGWGKNFFQHGVPIRKDGHPAGQYIDSLASEGGIFGNPKAPYIEEYLLYMLEDIGYTVNWNAPRSLVSQEHRAYHYNRHTDEGSVFDVVLREPTWQSSIVRGVQHQRWRGE